MALDPLIGKQLGDYTIVGLLGRGGMSRVYRGYDENLQRYAAVKVISSDFATTSEEEYTRRFQSEARAIAHLRHPNIVGIYQFGRSEGIYYMAQVFLEGKDLRVVLKSYAERGEHMPSGEMLRIVGDIAAALDYAHAQGVIHRDVKPSNIMLERHTGRAILMDFGLALSVQEGTTGETFGSAHYIAPEQALSSAQAVPQSDLYSLGIVIYEILAGQVPFDDPSAMSVALKHLNVAPPPPSVYNPNIPQAVEEVVLRALDKDPQRRYPSGKALVAALTAACASAPQPVAPAAGPSADLLAMIEAPRHTPAIRPPGDETLGLAAPEPPSDPGTHDLASRFARRKAAKEEQAAALAAAEDELQIDERTLDSILSGYADPRDIGLVGPDAPGLKPAHRDLGGGSGGARRGSRRLRGALIAAILVLSVVAGALVWTNLLHNDEGGPSEEPVANSALIDATGTATGAATAADVTPVAGQAGAAPEESATPSRTPTPRRPARTPTTTAGPPTRAPSETPAGAAPDASAPDVRLIYGPDVFVLLNVAGRPLDVSDLVFEQTGADGDTRHFEAAEWDRYISGSSAYLEAESCLQLITSDAARPAPDDETCPRLAGYYRTATVERYFWRSDEPDASFTVRLGEAALATCAIAAGECNFALPPP